MQIVLPYTYTAQVIPPRCRKPRPERMTGKITLTIREITAADAPVAIIERGQRLGAKRHVHYAIEYRWFGKKLYVRQHIQRYCHGPIRTQSARQFVKDPYPFKLDKNDGHGYNTKAEVRAEMLGWARELLFIDGERWVVADEPRYEILTFGLGHNHGIGWGTTLDGTTHFNQNVSRDRYFRCDQYEEAVAEATRIATARGDTKALPIAKQRPTRYEILIPEAETYLATVKKLAFFGVTGAQWKAIRDEGLDQEQNVRGRRQWLAAALPLAPDDAAGLIALNDEVIEKFNRFDILLKEQFRGRVVDLIDYLRGTVTLVTTVARPRCGR